LQETEKPVRVEQAFLFQQCHRLPPALAATHAVATIEAFVTGTTPDGDMTAGVTGRCIALHALRGRIYRVQAVAVHP
jgi:hypothetical protein